MSEWLTALQKAKKSCIQDGNLKKIHYDFEDGKEMVEEYNTDTYVVNRRAWKKKSGLGGDGDWEIEIGDPEPTFNKDDHALIKESSSQPIISRRITKRNLEWRIRNLPYPLETYSVSASKEETCIIVRTTNKKYFKKLVIPDLERLNLVPEQENICFSHKFNTLIITYKKPQQMIDFENKLLKDVKNISPKDYGDVNNCKPS